MRVLLGCLVLSIFLLQLRTTDKLGKSSWNVTTGPILTLPRFKFFCLFVVLFRFETDWLRRTRKLSHTRVTGALV